MTTENDEHTERSGYPELGRSIELLWGTRERPGRGPKPGLSIDQIVHTAIDVADAEGLPALSMRRIAHHLGFTTMSLYRYVPGKAELVELMLDTVVGEPPAVESAVTDWRAELARWARAHLAIFQRHPWALQVVVTNPPTGPNNLAWFEVGLRALSRTGLTEVEMIYAVLLVNNYVRGAAAQLAVGLVQAWPHTGVSAQGWGTVYGRFLARVVDAGRYPTLARLVSSGVFAVSDEQSEQDDNGFEFGLDRVLDGIEALVRSRAEGDPCAD